MDFSAMREFFVINRDIIIRTLCIVAAYTFFTAAYVAGCFACALARPASVSRILFAMGRDGLLPKVFTKVNPATQTPVKTVESYWPYATTLFDYVKRAMPFSAPGSLPDDDVYAVVAYILAQAKIIGPGDTLDATTLPKVAMPNRDGFVPDPRPERQLYR